MAVQIESVKHLQALGWQLYRDLRDVLAAGESSERWLVEFKKATARWVQGLLAAGKAQTPRQRSKARIRARRLRSFWWRPQGDDGA